MIATRAVGRNAASRKYDLLTALGAHALASNKGKQRIVLRLITLITARYNWKADELVVGRREMAQLWNVDERTVKREMAKLRGFGWIEVKRPGARGRITSYRLLIDAILRDTQPAWNNVGKDFTARMELSAGIETQSYGQGAVVAFKGPTRVEPPDVASGDEWSLASGVLYSEDSQSFGAWFRMLKRQERTGDRLFLMAPSKFHAHYVQTHLYRRLLHAVRSVDETVATVAILFPEGAP